MAADDIERLTRQMTDRVWGAIVDQETFLRLSAERTVISRKQKEDRILVRYVGEAFEKTKNKALAPTLEDFYMDRCI